jgi:hypothetical protein
MTRAEGPKGKLYQPDLTLPLVIEAAAPVVLTQPICHLLPRQTGRRGRALTKAFTCGIAVQSKLARGVLVRGDAPQLPAR